MRDLKLKIAGCLCIASIQLTLAPTLLFPQSSNSVLAQATFGSFTASGVALLFYRYKTGKLLAISLLIQSMVYGFWYFNYTQVIPLVSWTWATVTCLFWVCLALFIANWRDH